MTELTFRLPGMRGRLLIFMALVLILSVPIMTYITDRFKLTIPLFVYSAYLWARTNKLHLLPLLPALAALLPMLNLTAATKLREVAGAATTTLLVADAVLISLSAARLGAGNCALVSEWTGYFREHNGAAIKGIQDALQCCGLNTVRTMAYPFPGHGVGVDECARTTGRSASCLARWRGEEQAVSVWMLAVGVVLAAIKVCAIRRGDARG